jgi:hypothetical protein
VLKFLLPDVHRQAVRKDRPKLHSYLHLVAQESDLNLLQQNGDHIYIVSIMLYSVQYAISVYKYRNYGNCFHIAKKNGGNISTWKEQTMAAIFVTGKRKNLHISMRCVTSRTVSINQSMFKMPVTVSTWEILR